MLRAIFRRAGVLLLQFAAVASVPVAVAQTKTAPYPAMLPIEQYMNDRVTEIALARSAAPASIAQDAEIQVLTRDGYVSAVSGHNGFTCLVERSWGKATDDPDFWNPKMRAPHCFNQQAARTFLPIYLMKTRLVLAGKSAPEIGQAMKAAFADGTFPALAPDGMAYMMSRQQYLGDRDKSWRPHLMFFYQGSVAGKWAADHADSPVMAGEDPEERVTILFVPVDTWSDKSAGPR